jgi:hypothetical protein
MHRAVQEILKLLPSDMMMPETELVNFMCRVNSNAHGLVFFLDLSITILDDHCMYMYRQPSIKVLRLGWVCFHCVLFSTIHVIPMQSLPTMVPPFLHFHHSLCLFVSISFFFVVSM